MSLDDIARTTRIARPFLHALEVDDLGALPQGPFAKGFIRAYCAALQAPSEPALALLEGKQEAPAGGRTPETPARESKSQAPVLVSFALLVLLGIALFGVTLALQSGRGTAPARPPERRAADSPPVPAPVPVRPAPEPAATETLATAASSRPSAPAATASPANPPTAASPRSASAPPVDRPAPALVPVPPSLPVATTAPAAPPPLPSPLYRLTARTSDPTWIRVQVEDGRATEETLPAGAVREWVSNRPFVLTIGNAGGITLELNGRAIPPLGGQGKVISRLVLPPGER